MSATLTIGPQLSLPLDSVTETFVILAKRGSGKTYTAAVMVEEMLDAGLPVCVIDPLGVWWGLRSSADGKREGQSVVIFGGDHADVPLEETAGRIIADVIVDKRIPAVIDLSLLSKSASRRFMVDFAERLYHRNREPLHLVIDEADAFAPQRTSAGGERLLGAIEDLVRRGRARGLGCTLITQRPAVLNKDVLTQAEVLIALRMTGPRDVAAIDEWVRLHADEDEAREVKRSLPSLPVGTAWVWSPGWLGILTKVSVRKRRTFDSSATPRAGQRRVEPSRMAAIDLAALGEQIQATVEQAKVSDPKALRARLATVEAELAAERAKPGERIEVQVPVPILEPSVVAELRETLGPLADILARIEQQLSTPLSEAHAETAAARRPSPPATLAAPTPAPKPQRATSPPTSDDVHLKAGARRILETLARHHPMRVTRAQLGTLAKFKVTGGTFLTYWGQLKRAGLVDENGDIGITPAGLDYVGVVTRSPMTTDELLDQWRGALKAGARAILDELVTAYPQPIDKEELAQRVGMTASGGTFQTYVGTLRRNGLAETNGSSVVASDALFLSGR